MTRTQFPWILIGILALASIAFGVAGFVVAAIALAIVYFLSLRARPRMRHIGFRGCGGTGEVRGALFTWTFHKCPHCQGGRHIRWGAGHFGTSKIQEEYKRNIATRKAAKQNGTWR